MSRWIAVFALLTAASFPAMADESSKSVPLPGVVTSIESGLPFVESFESGSLANWVVNAGASGNALVQADTTLNGGNAPHTGSYVAFLGASVGVLTTATLDLHMNLSAVDVVEIDFWWLGHGLDFGEFARVDVYDGAWHLDVDGLQSQPTIWTNHTITLDRGNYTFSNDVVLRFTAVVDATETSDAVYLDDVSVQGFTASDDLVVAPRNDGQSTGMAVGPFTPGAYTYTLYNKGGSALDWTAATAAAWLDIAPPGGNLAPGASVDVTATINATANGFATYERHTAMVDFTNTTSAYTESRTVELDVLGVFYQDLLDADPGWTTEGAWAYGVPTGGGSHNFDPAAGHTGANVYGYNLAGDYVNSMPPYSLTSTAFDCSTMAGTHVEFWRWLGVEDNVFDHAVFQVSIDGGTWTPIWGNPGDAEVSESAWSQQTYDISSVADGQPTVYLRWIMGPTDFEATYPGWNIDDVTLYGANAGPEVTSVTVTPGYAGARLDIATNVGTTLDIRWGATQGGPFPQQIVDGSSNTIFLEELHPLVPSQRYYYTVEATDALGGTGATEGYFDTLNAHHVPFNEDFEGGDLDNFDLNYDMASGTVVLDMTLENGFNPYDGANVARFQGAGVPSVANCDLVLDLSGLNAVELSFAWLAHALDTGKYLRVDLYDGMWHSDVLEADPDAGGWELKKVIISAGQYNMIDGFIVRFQASMSATSEPSDSAYLDAISLRNMSSTGELLVTGPVSPSMSGIAGGPFAPNCLTYTLTNLSGANLNWGGSANKTWLDVTPPAGTLAPGASVEVDVCANAFANALAVGHYMATARFTNNTSGVSTDKAFTLDVQQAAASYNMDADPGFTPSGAWAYGVPTGGGNSNGDPTSGYTGANVYGYNLVGNYATNLPETPLTTPAIDCSNLKNVTLSFWRWLAIESAQFDHAKVQVSNDNATWHDVWKHTGDSVSPMAWTHVSYDISAWADGQATVYIRWIMGATDGSVFYPGWNIDDVVVAGVPTVDPIDPSLPPTLIVGEPSRYYARPGQQVSYDLYYEGASAITLADEDIALLATASANADVFITGSGTLQRKVRLLNLTGDGWLGLNLDFGTAHDTFGNVANRVADTAWFYVDSTAPNIYIAPPTLAITDNGPVSFNIIYSGADGVPLTVPDILIDATGTASGTVTVLGAGRYSRKVRFNNTLGNGQLRFSLADMTAYDFAGNLAVIAGPSDRFRVDNTPPVNPVSTPPVASFSEPTRWTANTTHQVKYTIAYRDASSISLADTDVVLQTAGMVNALVAVTGSGVLQRKITLYDLEGEGTIGFSLNAGTASNAYGSAPATPVGPIFTVDNTGPGVYVTAPSQRVTTTTPITYTVFYSGAEAITLGPGNVVVQTTGSANVGLVQVTGAGRYQRKVRLNNLTGKGAVGISLNANTAVDSASNPAPGTLPSIVAQVLN